MPDFRQWILISNRTGRDIGFWFEPWGDYYEFHEGDQFAMCFYGPEPAIQELQIDDDGVMVWGWGAPVLYRNGAVVPSYAGYEPPLTSIGSGQADISVENKSSHAFPVGIEPWGDEVSLVPGDRTVVSFYGASGDGEIDLFADQVVVWGWNGIRHSLTKNDSVVRAYDESALPVPSAPSKSLVNFMGQKHEPRQS